MKNNAEVSHSEQGNNQDSRPERKEKSVYPPVLFVEFKKFADKRGIAESYRQEYLQYLKQLFTDELYQHGLSNPELSADASLLKAIKICMLKLETYFDLLNENGRKPDNDDGMNFDRPDKLKGDW